MKMHNLKMLSNIHMSWSLAYLDYENDNDIQNIARHILCGLTKLIELARINNIDPRTDFIELDECEDLSETVARLHYCTSSIMDHCDVNTQEIDGEAALWFSSAIRYCSRYIAENNIDVDEVPDTNVILEGNYLYEFINKEVPFRLCEALEIADGRITPGLIRECVTELYDNSDVMFDYEAIDEFLEQVIDAYDDTQE